MVLHEYKQGRTFDVTVEETIKQKYLRLSKGQKIVAQYVLSHPNLVVESTIAKLSGRIGVSESTIVRFCYAIDLQGFATLQQALKVDFERPKKKSTSESVLW